MIPNWVCHYLRLCHFIINIVEFVKNDLQRLHNAMVAALYAYTFAFFLRLASKLIL